jgi:hypothetical protein
MNFDHRSPGHQVEAESLAEILVGRNVTKWLRLYGRPWSREQSLQRM